MPRRSIRAAGAWKGSKPPMIASILKQLERLPKRAAFEPYRAALLAAAEHREAIIPELIAVIDQASDPAAPPARAR